MTSSNGVVAPDEDDGDHLEQSPVLCSEPAWSKAFPPGQLPEIALVPLL